MINIDMREITMQLPILKTKLYKPQLPSKIVKRTHLIEQMNRGSENRLTLISASAGFGKTILLCQWADNYNYPIGWISIDEEHNDLMRFLLYILAAIQSANIHIDETIIGMVLSPQPPPYKTILTLLLNEIANLEDDFSLILDDYHLIDSKEVDEALTFLIDNMPSQMHILISTRIDPDLPIARLRAQGQMVEIRVADMRFKQSEIAEFMNQTMQLELAEKNISALEMCTEGWISGLKLAAISMQGNSDISGFIESFTSSNRYIIDYLVEEVLNKLSENIQEFLLRTSVLDRMSGPLCDEIFPSNAISGQETLEYLEKINMFVIPLDPERRWYRYHHLFAQILRQRLSKNNLMSVKKTDGIIEDIYLRASNWFEKNDFYAEAFKYAAKTNDVERAQRLIKGDGVPLQFLGTLNPILDWFASLEKKVFDANPSLWVTYASTLCMASKFDAVEDKLVAAEAALEGREQDDFVYNLIGHIASNRALLATVQRNTKTALFQSKIALEHLDSGNIAVRTSCKWILGMAYHAQGNLEAARISLEETIATCNSTGNVVVGVSAASILGTVYEEKSELHLAATTYQNILKIQKNMPLSTSAYFSHIGLARIYYEWNMIEESKKHCLKSIELSKQLTNTDIIIDCEIFHARLKIFYKDYEEALAILVNAYKTIELNNFTERLSDVTNTQVMIMLKQGDLSNAYELTKEFNIPISEARVCLAKNEVTKTIDLLEPLLIDAKKTGREDQRLKILILLSYANNLIENTEKAIELLEEALLLSEPNNFMRSFIDEGEQVINILKQTSVSDNLLDYKIRIIKAFESDESVRSKTSVLSTPQPLIENLSKREIEVLQLIAQGLSNREICEMLFIAIDTVKGHNRRIYGKLGVNNRTSAIKRASTLGIINM